MKRIAWTCAWFVLAALVSFASDSEAPSALRVKSLLDQVRHEEARQMGEALLAQLESGGQGSSLEAAVLRDLLVRAARQRNDYGGPIREMARRAAEIKQSLLGPDDPGVADSLFELGMLLVEAGELDAGRLLLERTLSLRETRLGREALEVAEVLLELANTLQRQGEFAAAAPLYDRALAIRQQRLGPDHADVASVLHNSANLRLRMGEFIEARARYQRSLEIRRKVLSPRHIDVALTLVTMGVLYQNMGDYDQAGDVLAEAISICREGEWRDSLLLSAALNNLGNVHWSLGEAARARDAYAEAYAIKLRRLGPDHPDLVQELNNLAVAHKALKEFDQAIPLLERAILLAERRLGADHPDLSFPLNNLANVLTLQGRYKEARPLYERTLGIRVARMGRRHPEAARTIMNLAGLSLAEGRRSEALALAREASDLSFLQIRDTLVHLSESAALELASARDEAHTILFEGLRTAKQDAPEWLEACWSWTLKRKGIVLEEMAARHRSALQGETAGELAAREDLARARSRLATLWAGGAGGKEPGLYQAEMKEALDHKESAEERLAGLSAGFRSERAQRRADLAAVRRSLRPGEALVEIARVEVGLSVLDDKPVHDIALVVRPDGGAAWEDLGLAKETDRRVASWRGALSAAIREREDPSASELLDRTGRELRRAIWDPIARHMAGASLVLIVPDGSLHQVDFGALPAEDGRFVLEDSPTLHILGSGRDVVARGQAAAAPRAGRRGLLALGSPDFNAPALLLAARGREAGSGLRGSASTCAAVRETTWSPLPEAAGEVETIAGLIRPREPVTVLTGAQAVEEALLREAPGRRLLHVATHGFFLGSCGAEVESPLLRSGLVLAGANRAPRAPEASNGSDGILTAEEIVAADLRGVELAVLSACDTGRGDVTVGEGVFGLRRALQIAGVRTIVMSLWPVPDRQARRWMVDFYRRHILEGAAAREAARSASLALLADLRARRLAPHPYLWTGFVVAGAAD